MWTIEDTLEEGAVLSYRERQLTCYQDLRSDPEDLYRVWWGTIVIYDGSDQSEAFDWLINGEEKSMEQPFNIPDEEKWLDKEWALKAFRKIGARIARLEKALEATK